MMNAIYAIVSSYIDLNELRVKESILESIKKWEKEHNSSIGDLILMLPRERCESMKIIFDQIRFDLENCEFCDDEEIGYKVDMAFHQYKSQDQSRLVNCGKVMHNH